jgi:hypothetical protein
MEDGDSKGKHKDAVTHDGKQETQLVVADFAVRSRR